MQRPSHRPRLRLHERHSSKKPTPSRDDRGPRGTLPQLATAFEELDRLSPNHPEPDLDCRAQDENDGRCNRERVVPDAFVNKTIP